jgi:hypothetical protein
VTRGELIGKARVAVAAARKRGDLVPEPCILCGRTDVDGHHEDYSKPLDVIWLCRRHHVWMHMAGWNFAQLEADYYDKLASDEARRIEAA